VPGALNGVAEVSLASKYLAGIADRYLPLQPFLVDYAQAALVTMANLASLVELIDCELKRLEARE
jgi:hypothetical protein